MDFETFDARLHERGASAACVICGHNNWRAFGVPDRAQTIVMVAEMPEGGFAVDHGHAAYGYACQNCGFIRLHAVQVIAPEEAP